MKKTWLIGAGLVLACSVALSAAVPKPKPTTIVIPCNCPVKDPRWCAILWSC